MMRVLAGIRILVADGAGAIDADAVRNLKALNKPPLRILEFLTDHGVIQPEARDALETWVARRLDPLPPGIRSEVQAWVDVLRGVTKRGGRPRDADTIQAYVTVLRPSLTAWSASYESLRQVTR